MTGPVPPLQLELIGAVADESRPLGELIKLEGMRSAEGAQHALLSLLRLRYVELYDADQALSLEAAELALTDPRSWESSRFGVHVTESGLRAWEVSRADRARDFADLERQARHLRGF